MAGFLRLCVIVVMMTGCRQILGFESPTVAVDDAAVDTPVDTALVVDTPVDTPVDTSAVGWTLRKRITIAADQVGGPLLDFPLLITRVQDAELAASARDDGFDIMFTAADGESRLSHEIERFNGTTGQLVAWVRIPSLSDTVDTEIYLYFGNPAATDQQDVAAVWNSNFVGVWHLDEAAGTAIADSTAFGRTGTKTAATTPNPANGIIGGGQMFAGGFDGISIGSSTELDLAGITVETWIRVAVCANDVYRRILDLPESFTHTTTISYPCTGAPGVNQKSVVVDASDEVRQTPTNSLTADVVHHLVVQTGPTTIYLDGIQQTLTTAPFGLQQTNTLAVIGNREASPDRSVIGLMDEVRISKVRRSPDFITTSFANQRPGSTMLTVGAVESAP